MQAQHAPEDVLVIGAGPAGIASAYALQQMGLSFKVVDRAHVIASTWDSLYPSLDLNTTRFYSHMPRKRFPLRYGIFPSGKQYHRYLLEYVREQGILIELGVEVRRVAPQDGLWRVETSTGTWLYRAVISATGIFGSPVMPQIEGLPQFRGQVLHAHDFRDPAQVHGKRVLVVGNGPSGIDIAVAAGDVAQSTHIAIRSGLQLKRRYPLGLPVQVWQMIGGYLPRAWCRRLLRFVGKFGYPEQERYGLPIPPAGSGGVTAYQGPELIDAVKAGKVMPLRAPVRFHADSVEFEDGRCLPFDTVILATGYQPVLHQYLDVALQYSAEAWKPQSACDWETGENGQRGWPLRDTSQHPNGRQIAGHPGLYLVGTFYKGRGAMYNFNIEAAIAAQQIHAYLAAGQS
jgi:cation diffusion facilitator CzcD-associated flavoprotein CzcO